MGGFAFDKLVQTEYKGASKTREFVENHAKAGPVDFNNPGETQRLMTRADLTIRRAFLHYRKAWDKLKTLKTKARDGKVLSCDHAEEQLILIFQAKRHFDKARLYIHPACFLSRAMLSFYADCWDSWMGKGGGTSKENSLNQLISKTMLDHRGYACLAEPACWKKMMLNGQAKGNNQVADEKLWDETHILELDKKLREAEEKLNLDPTLARPGISFSDPGISEDTKNLYFDARERYVKNRGFGTKLLHMVQNFWNEKTLSEKGKIVAAQVGSLAFAALGTGVSTVPDITAPASAALAYLMQIGEEGFDEAADKVAESQAKQYKPAEVRKTGVVKEGQENLMRAAIHLREAANLVQKLPGRKAEYEKRYLDGDYCETALDILAEEYTFKHHLFKAQAPLEEAIEMVEALVKALVTDLKDLKKNHNIIVNNIDIFMAQKKHKECRNVCIFIPSPDAAAASAMLPRM